MENRITLKDVLANCENFKATKDENGFNSWFEENIKIKNYMPLEDKLKIIDMATERISIMDATMSGSALYSIEYDCVMFFYVLLAYTNVEVDSALCTYKNYDILHEWFFYDYILDEVGRDYSDTVKMVETACGITNILSIKNILGSLDQEKISEHVTALNNIMSDKETMKAIETIISFDDPLLKKYRQNLDRTKSQMAKKATQKLEVKK